MSRILIAEDEPRLASFLEKGLRASGFTTTVVADGPGAESLADESDFDLLILDLSLPGKDGLEVLRGMRSAGSRLPVIILTASGDPHDRVEGLESGADDYLAKPFHFEELVARVRVQLRGGDRPSRRHSSGSAGSRSTCAPAGRASTARRSSSAPASSSSCGPSSSTPTRSSAASSCSPVSGAMTTTRARTSSTCTWGTCARSWAGSGSRPCAGSGYRFRA